MRTWSSSISPGTSSTHPTICSTFSLSPEREVTDHTELELIFESYYADFEEIVAEIKTVKVYSHYFFLYIKYQQPRTQLRTQINSYQPTLTAWEIRCWGGFALICKLCILSLFLAFRMSLMMEMGALALGSGAVVGGVFGMNLVSGLEEHPQGEL